MIRQLPPRTKPRLARLAAQDDRTLPRLGILDLGLQCGDVDAELRQRIVENLEVAVQPFRSFLRLVAFEQRTPREIVATLADGDLGLALPFTRLVRQPALPPDDLLAVRDGPGRRAAHLDQRLLHFLDDQADHLLRVLGLVEDGVEVGIHDVR